MAVKAQREQRRLDNICKLLHRSACGSALDTLKLAPVQGTPNLSHPLEPPHLMRPIPRPSRPFLLIALAFLTSAALNPGASGRDPTFNPRLLGAGMTGVPTQVMVLGTNHLSNMPPNFQTAYLAPLLERLTTYRPDIITIEGISGQDCEYLHRYRAIVPGLADEYCWPTDAAQKATGLDVPEATAALALAMASWPERPTDANRRHLASLFLAANDRPSAVVQWLRLPLTQRHAADGLDATLVALLNKVAASRNENVAIAATLAARLGLERVYSVDDHSADTITATLGPNYGAAMKRVWSGPSTAREALLTRERGVRDGESLMALYRFLNDPGTARSAVSADMGRALKQQTPELYGRQYVAWWETRNLRMAANIRAAAGNTPGARVLSIVGSSHKPYFETYLGMMSDVTIANTSAVLAR